jgi:hypothetical protein
MYQLIESIAIRSCRQHYTNYCRLGVNHHLIYFVLLLIGSVMVTNRVIIRSFEYSLSQFRHGIVKGVVSMIRSLNVSKIVVIAYIVGLVLLDTTTQGVVYGVDHDEVFNAIQEIPDEPQPPAPGAGQAGGGGVVAEADLKIHDNQNVHNGSVSRHLAECIRRLRDKEGPERPHEEVYGQIRQYLRASQHLRSDEAVDTLDVMYNLNGQHTLSQLREMDIVRLVWQRIHDPVNVAHVDDLKQSLLLQLADCKSAGGILCLTGRVTRVVQSLECIDAENIVDLKPLWAIKPQIASYCSRYTDKLLPKVSEEYRQAFLTDNEKRTGKQSEMARQYARCVKRNLDRKFQMMYLDTGLLTSSQLDSLKQAYYEGIDQL